MELGKMSQRSFDSGTQCILDSLANCLATTDRELNDIRDQLVRLDSRKKTLQYVMFLINSSPLRETEL